MMFSSNQKLEISGPIDRGEYIKNALDFILHASGQDRHLSQEEIERGCFLTYQITEDGRYCIGWGYKELPQGWEKYPFDFDTEIVSKIIAQCLSKAPLEEGMMDGSYCKGFLAKCINTSFADEKDGIKSPFYGIAVFEPYTCFYAK